MHPELAAPQWEALKAFPQRVVNRNQLVVEVEVNIWERRSAKTRNLLVPLWSHIRFHESRAAHPTVDLPWRLEWIDHDSIQKTNESPTAFGNISPSIFKRVRGGSILIEPSGFIVCAVSTKMTSDQEGRKAMFQIRQGEQRLYNGEIGSHEYCWLGPIFALTNLAKILSLVTTDNIRTITLHGWHLRPLS